MKGRKGRFLFTLFLTLLVFGFGTRIVRADETDNFQSDKKSIETAETKILEEEFDFKEIEKSLSELFPKEKISFEEVVFSFLSGEPGEMLELLTGYIRDEIAYEFLYSKKTLVYIILIAVMAAVFSNFAGAFQSRQISGISFYVVYMLLITLCLMSFRTAVYGISEKLESLTTLSLIHI